MNELPPMVASRTAASRSRRLELASVLQAASRLIHGYAIDAPVDRPHELRKLPRTVNGTGHTGPSEFCATSI